MAVLSIKILFTATLINIMNSVANPINTKGNFEMFDCQVFIVAAFQKPLIP